MIQEGDSRASADSRVDGVCRYGLECQACSVMGLGPVRLDGRLRWPDPYSSAPCQTVGLRIDRGGAGKESLSKDRNRTPGDLAQLLV